MITKTGKDTVQRPDPLTEGSIGAGAGIGAFGGAGAIAKHVANKETLSTEQADRLIKNLRSASGKGGKFHYQYGPGESASAMERNYFKSLPKKIQRATNFHPLGRYIQEGADVLTTNKNPGIAAHEMGHLSGRAVNSKLYNKVQALSRVGAGGGVLGLASSVPAAYMSATSASKDPEDKSKGQEMIRKGVTYGPGAVMAPTLFEEGRASTKGFNLLRKTRGLRTALKSLPTMGAGFGTYATAAALPIIAASIAKNRTQAKLDKGKSDK